MLANKMKEEFIIPFLEQSIIIIDPDEMISNTRHNLRLRLYLYQFLRDDLRESKIQNESQGGFSHLPPLVWLKSTSIGFTRGAVWSKLGNGPKRGPNRWWECDPDQTQLLKELCWLFLLFFVHFIGFFPHH